MEIKSGTRDQVLSPDRNALGCLVSFAGHDFLRLDGMLYRAEDPRATIVHVHGSFGNFYQNEFVRVLAYVLQRRNYNLLTFNTSAHDGISEGNYLDGRFAYVGASLTRFETCQGDILGACDFAKRLGAPIVLSGHSLGCDRVIWACLQSNLDYPVALLAPCDSYQLQRRLLAGETVEAQRARLRAEAKAAPPDRPDWLAPHEYGVRSTAAWTYPNPITREPFLSISEGPPYQLFRYDQSPCWHLGNQGIVITPLQDALLTCHTTEVADFFAKAMPRSHQLTVDGDHLFAGYEAQLAGHFHDWLQGLQPPGDA